MSLKQMAPPFTQTKTNGSYFSRRIVTFITFSLKGKEKEEKSRNLYRSAV
jgi:hypothetical protein